MSRRTLTVLAGVVAVLVAGVAAILLVVRPGSAPDGDRAQPPSSRPSSGVPSSTGPSPGPTVAQGGTVYGAAVGRSKGEDFAAALARADRDLGGLDIVRVFYPGAPEPWPGLAGTPERSVVVSFKMPPAAVAAGAFDDTMLAWFRGAPKNRDVYWSYFHEPEDNIEEGEFTAPDYQAAWRRLAGLADRAANERLKATLVLMCYTFDDAAQRRWQDYYPGAEVVDVMAYDCYSRGAKKGVYERPDQIFGRAVENARALGKPFAVAEFGSILAKDDDGSGRAEWLQQVGRYLADQKAVFVTYFDATVGGEYRLLDAQSKAAWREFTGR